MSKRYRVGIDVGLKSVGLAAIEIDDSDQDPQGAYPIKILNVQSVIHDGGVDPDEAKFNNSRMQSSGVARRTRKLRKRRTARLKKLDNLLQELGYDCESTRKLINSQCVKKEPYFSWKMRALAAENFIQNDAERQLAVVISLRSIARHRGWRNPYASVDSLREQSEVPSDFYCEFVRKLIEGKLMPEGSPDVCSGARLTPAQLIAAKLLNNRYAFRSDASFEPKEMNDSSELESGLSAEIFKSDASFEPKKIPLGKLHQSDYYHEAKKILDTQQVPKTDQEKLLELIFEQVNPRDVGAAAKRIARDDLNKSKIRASKASPEFQRYRILTTLSNLFVKKQGESLPLTDEQRKIAYEFLTSSKAAKKEPTWHDLAETLSLTRNDLSGVGGVTEDGEPISVKHPPIMNTEQLIIKNKNKIKPVYDWWQIASDLEKEMFIEACGNAGISGDVFSQEELQALSLVDEMLERLDEKVIAELEKINFPSGRVAYSFDTMRQLNKCMLADGLNLHEARKKIFDVDDSWHPSANPLGAITGHPAADRTIKIVSRWLKACVKKWGVPETVNIEYARDGFTSPKKAREYELESQKRYEANRKVREEVCGYLIEQGIAKDVADVKSSDIKRYLALYRQNNQCLYCGSPNGLINFKTAQMDHIVPRKGAGSSNEKANLVAVCADCNKSKSNMPFAKWADKKQIDETMERINRWTKDPSFPNNLAFNKFKNDVKDRLLKTEADDPIDNRSLEAVAWMGRELCSQIEGYLADLASETSSDSEDSVKRVRAFRGQITASARKASGLEGKLPWIGGASHKSRIDRRHHAVDASVIAMLRPSVAQVLIERDSMRQAFFDTQDKENFNWKEHVGSDFGSIKLFKHWQNEQMAKLTELLQRAMQEDRVVVTNPLRLGLSRGKAHDDTIERCVTLKLGDSMTASAIDRVSDAAVWTALTRLEDYNLNTGLPPDFSRSITVHGVLLNADSDISFMASKKSDLQKEKDAILCPVRNGFAVAGNAVHHARIYRIPKSNGNGYDYAMLRVVVIDLVKCHGNLFEYVLPEHSLSFRFANKKLKTALCEGKAEYLGWIVVGDEIIIDPEASYFSPEGTSAINRFIKCFPGTCHFKITGLSTKTKVKIEPMQFSREEFGDLVYNKSDWSDSDIKAIESVLSGVLISVNELFASGVDVVRRSILGYSRWSSLSGVPSSWSTRALG